MTNFASNSSNPDLDAAYHLCAIDLDDTLLDASHNLSPRSIQTITRARDLGVKVVLASGRMHAAMARFAAELELDTPLISYNGALVQRLASVSTPALTSLEEARDVWLEEKVSADLATEIRAYATANNLQLNYYLHDILYSAADTPWLQLYSKRTGAPIEILPDFEARLQQTTPTKLVIVDAPAKVAELLPRMQERFANRLYVTRSNAEYLEFMPPNASKGRALELVANRLHIPAEKVVAFGDSWNDIPMLNWAGLGLAVANAKPEVIAAADRVIPSNSEDGVAAALEELLFKENS